ncbi:MAG: hypothetical protein WC614_02395 [bacterium]
MGLFDKRIGEDSIDGKSWLIVILTIILVVGGTVLLFTLWKPWGHIILIIFFWVAGIGYFVEAIQLWKRTNMFYTAIKRALWGIGMLSFGISHLPKCENIGMLIWVIALIGVFVTYKLEEKKSPETMWRWRKWESTRKGISLSEQFSAKYLDVLDKEPYEYKICLYCKHSKVGLKRTCKIHHTLKEFNNTCERFERMV